jgi:hypothetical protein
MAPWVVSVLYDVRVYGVRVHDVRVRVFFASVFRVALFVVFVSCVSVLSFVCVYGSPAFCCVFVSVSLVFRVCVSPAFFYGVFAVGKT